LNKVKVQCSPLTLLLSKWGRFRTLFHEGVVEEYERGSPHGLASAPTS
jgi:hypothetical protein